MTFLSPSDRNTDTDTHTLGFIFAGSSPLQLPKRKRYHCLLRRLYLVKFIG